MLKAGLGLLALAPLFFVINDNVLISGVWATALTSLLVHNGTGKIMCIDELLKSADFSKETNFKERLYNKLNMLFSDGELDDDEAASVVAARGVISLPVCHRESKDD